MSPSPAKHLERGCVARVGGPRLWASMVLLTVGATMGGGCAAGLNQADKEARGFGLGLKSPRVRSSEVYLEEQSPFGVRVVARLELVNPNDVSLPLGRRNYKLSLGELGSFSFKDQAVHTLPPRGTQTIELPAAIATQQPVGTATPFRVRGWVEYDPPGTLRKILEEYYVPLPKIRLKETGRLSPAPRAKPTADRPAG